MRLAERCMRNPVKAITTTPDHINTRLLLRLYISACFSNGVLISTGRVSIIPFFPPCSHSSHSFIALIRFSSQHVLFKLGLVLHPTLGGHRILPANPLLCLHVLLVRHMLLLLGCHVLRCHALAARHAGLWGWDLGVVHVFGRVDSRFGINTVLVARCRLGRIKASLGRTTLMGDTHQHV